MGLREIAIGGIYVPPLLPYALLGLIAALSLRYLLHRLLGPRRPWYEAWFDVSLVLLCTAAVAFLFSSPLGIL